MAAKDPLVSIDDELMTSPLILGPRQESALRSTVRSVVTQNDTRVSYP